MAAATFQIVLRHAVENLGEAGELVKVRPGYARNYLIPRGLAVRATRGNIQQVEHERKLAVARAEKLRKEAEGWAAAMANVTVEVTKQAGEEGKLFGSVTAQEVAEALKAQGFDIDRRKLEMPEGGAIKSVGSHKAKVNFGSGVHAEFTIKVSAE